MYVYMKPVLKALAGYILKRSLEACKIKMLKHYRLSNWMYGVVLLLDPRHKKGAFRKTAWGEHLENVSYSMSLM